MQKQKKNLVKMEILKVEDSKHRREFYKSSSFDTKEALNTFLGYFFILHCQNEQFVVNQTRLLWCDSHY